VSTLNVDTVAAVDGAGAATLTRQSLAKALAVVQQTGTMTCYAPTSLNISSVTDGGLGNSTLNQANAMAVSHCPVACEYGWPSTSWTAIVAAAHITPTNTFGIQHVENNANADSSGLSTMREGVLA
jgi:hypothetical protein